VSLSGSVEDLPLLEILQVVAFTQKTGNLTVDTAEGEAGVVFSAGRVVAGYIWDLPPLGAEQPEGPAEDRQGLLRERITSTLERLVRLREGEFRFNVADAVPVRLGDRDLSREMIDDGINPEGLMLDLARQLDEDRRESAAALEVSFSESLPPDSPSVNETLPARRPREDAPPRRTRVLLVDDEPEVRRLVGEQLVLAGCEIVEAEDTLGARRQALRLARDGTPFLLLTDLGLPSLGGSNFRGGLELADFAKGLEPRPRVLLMADRAEERLRRKARRLGVSILVVKPGLSKLDPRHYEAELRAFGQKLAEEMVPRLLERARKGDGAPAVPPLPGPPDDETAREATLTDALEELARSPEPDQVAFLLLRAARAFVPRALLFVVKEDLLQGVAGFGPTANGRSLDVVARDLAVSLEEPSPFADAVGPGTAWTGSPQTSEPGRTLLERIGTLQANAATVIPVRAQRETIAVLYGDDPRGRPLPELEPLRDFAERAGRALDEAFLALRGGGRPA
jgi:CheY-like chemotaxis protein